MENKSKNTHSLFLQSGCLTEEAIILFLEGHLSEKEKSIIDAHLLDCELCASGLEGYKLLLSEKSPAEIQETITKIKSKIDVNVFQKHRKSYIRPLLALAAMLILVFASFMIFRLIYSEKEPVIAKLSVPEPKNNLPPQQQLKAENEAKMEKESEDGKNVLKDVNPEDNVSAMGGAKKTVMPEAIKNLATEEINEKSDETSNVIVANKDYAAGAVGQTTLNTNVQMNYSYAPSSPGFSQDSTFIKTDKMYQLNAVSESYTIASGTSKRAAYQKSKSEEYQFIETMPEYPGGVDSMNSFIQRNIKYPESALKQNIQGMVMVSFFVENDGILSNLKVVEGIGYGCNEEAIRVVKLMPKWKAGTKNGKTAKVQMTIPVKFSLPE